MDSTSETMEVPVKILGFHVHTCLVDNLVRKVDRLFSILTRLGVSLIP